MFGSTIVLGNVDSSLITYKINLYNNSDKDYLFIGTLTSDVDDALYSNENIEFVLNGLEDYTTTIGPKESIDFTITFKYKTDADVNENTLTSKLNFRFKEVPVLTLDGEGQTYNLSDIYPNYTPQDYEFIVSNYDEDGINNVPMSYYFETTIDSPLTVKIYDENDNEVSGNMTIEGDGVQKVDHTYTLKVIWDDSNPASDFSYNNSEYANKEFECNVVLKASPDSDKYLNYAITKEFDIDIKTSSLYFEIDADQNIKVEKDGSNFAISINNYVSDSEYNKFNIGYEISITDNDKFTYTIDEEEPVDGVFSRTLGSGANVSDSFEIKLDANIDDLAVTESATMNIIIKSPYKEEITVPLTISLQEVVLTLDANGGTVSPSIFTVYKGKTYIGLPTPTWIGHTFDGWYTAVTDGTKIESITEVTTSSSTQTLYARWTSHLLVDFVSIGEYVNYPVNYSNVATKNDGTLLSSYTGWMVIGFDSIDGKKYVKLMSAGIPMTYRHIYSTTNSSVADTSVANLTTNFFSTPINSTLTDNTFTLCGFKTATGGSITTIAQLKNLFNNSYTQVVSGVPQVRSVVREDLENLGLTVGDVVKLQDSSLFTTPAATPTGGYSYAGYWIASKYNNYYLYAFYYSGYIVYTYGAVGVRTVVYLDPNVVTTGQVNGIWQLSEE